MEAYGSILNSGANLSDPDQKRIFFDQYKLFIDSTSKIATARKETNTVYITLNFAILSTVGFIAVGKVFPDKNLLLVATLMIIGIGSVMSWLSVLSLYKTIDYESYNITKEFETYLPGNVYTRFNQYLSHENEAGGDKSFMVQKEKIISCSFFVGYSFFIGFDLYKLYLKVF